LVTRAWDTDEGVVRVGGVDVREQRREDLMAQLAVVSQDVHLFDDTLRDNVLLGRPDATDEELDRAARLAGVDALVERLPQGWATRVGESGARLSGGERQRVSIARALLKQAPIVVLDEVTAALDPVNEHLVRRSVAEMAEHSTVLVVAHTPAMISLADHVVVLDRGRVVQTGTVDELLAAPGPFARLWGDRRSAAAWTLS
jgi:ATP-binding cassette subfamily B protein